MGWGEDRKIIGEDAFATFDVLKISIYHNDENGRKASPKATLLPKSKAKARAKTSSSASSVLYIK